MHCSCHRAAFGLRLNGSPLPYSCLENPVDREGRRGSNVRAVHAHHHHRSALPDTARLASRLPPPASGLLLLPGTVLVLPALWGDPRHLSGEGDGTPLPYSCLENPMDGGAWWAAVHGVAKSRTGLSNFTFTFHFHALEKEMATHSSVLAWSVPLTAEPGGLLSMGSHRVGHD